MLLSPGHPDQRHHTCSYSMKHHLRSLWAFLTELIDEFMVDGCTNLAASLAYFAVFSLPPLIVIISSIASTFLDATYVSNQVSNGLSGFLGESGAQQIGV